MTEQELARYTGSMQQLAYVRPVTFGEGLASGLKAYMVKSGEMQFLVLADKCLDIAELAYKGKNLCFYTKPGLIGRNHYDTNGHEAQRSIMGGLFFTCGLENVCPPCVDGEKAYPMHGRLRSTPGEHLGADAYWNEAGEYRMHVRGEMREAELFGENITLRREIETVYGSRTITVRDRFQNHTGREEPMLLLYHFNVGYPLLNETTELILPTRSTVPRDDAGRVGLHDWSHMGAPVEGAREQVFTHSLAADAGGDTFAAAYNPALGLGLMIEFNVAHLPKFMQWKSLAAGDYVLGLEPANTCVEGRLRQKREGLPTLAPYDKREIMLRITVLDGEAEYAAARQRASSLIKAANQ